MALAKSQCTAVDVDGWGRCHQFQPLAILTRSAGMPLSLLRGGMASGGLGAGAPKTIFLSDAPQLAGG